MNGLKYDIQTQEDAMTFAKERPEEALGLALWNLVEMKDECRACGKIYVTKKAAKVFALAMVFGFLCYGIGFGLFTWQEFLSTARVIPIP